MKKFTKIIAICLCALMMLSALSVAASAVTTSVSGSDKVVTEAIKVNGKDTGATLSQAKLNANTKYAGGSDLILNVVEANPADPLISFETLNGGTYTYSVNTMGKESVKYNTNHPGETVLAAMNTDPWFLKHTDYTGDGKTDAGTATNVKHVSVFRGVMIVDGELWATQQIADEGNMSCGSEGEGVASTQASFAYTSTGKAFIGDPGFRITVKNETTAKTVAAQGINRLAAPKSIIIYNYRGGNESYAHSDAYEIYLKCDSTAAFKVDQALTGTITHVFKSGDTSARPAIDANTVVVSARSQAQIDRMIGAGFKIGDKVTVTPTVAKDSENNANKSLWKDVETATGGFWTIVLNGNRTGGGQGQSTRYPCPIVGIKADGTVLMITHTSVKDGSRTGLTQDAMYDLVKELGCVDALMFDGGGSTQLITLEGNDYIRRCSTSDGTNSVRTVVNGLALVYHEGANTAPVNQEKTGIQFLDGVGLADTGTYTPTPDGTTPTPPTPECTEHKDEDGNLKCDVCGEELPDPNAPVIPEVVFTGSPSWAYFYAGTVTSINGVARTDEVYGMRNPAYQSGWSSEEKQANAIQPGTIDGSNITLLEGNKLAITGWALANGSQKRILWSVDKQNWYEVSGGEFSSVSNDVVNLVTSNVWVKSVSAEHGAFTDVEANLDMFAGQTIDVHFAVTPGADDKALHFLTIEDIVVPEPKVECTEHVDANGDEACDVCGEFVPAEVTTEETTEEISEVTTEEITTEAVSVEETTVEETTPDTLPEATEPATEEDSSEEASEEISDETPSTDDPTEAPTDEVTEAPTEAPTDAATTTPAATEIGGCSSSAALGALAIVSGIAVAFATKKKENE